MTPDGMTALSGASRGRNGEPPASRGLRGRENQLVLVLIAGVSLMASLVARDYLPSQFLLDDGHLQQSMDRGHWAPDAASFQTVAAAYRALGLADAAPIAALIGMALFVVAVTAAVRWDRIPELTSFDLLLVGAVFLPGLAYLAQYTKELATLLVVIVVVLLPVGRTAARVGGVEVTILALLTAYGAAVRPYWLIIAALYAAWRWLLPRTSHPLALIGLPVLAYAVLQPAFRAVFDHGLQGQRDWANNERAGQVEVNSLITSIAPEAAGALGVLAALGMVALMVIPVDLLSSGSPFHVLSGLAFTVIWLVVLVPVVRGRFVEQSAGSDAPDRTDRIRGTRAAALLLSFLMVQALFEPDYGSALKHLTPMLPLVLVVHLARRRNV